MPKTTKTSFQYDAYGNIIKANNYGDITTTSDDTEEAWTFAYNTPNWITNKKTSYLLTQSGSTSPLRKANYYYDSLPFGNSPIKGDLTKTETYKSPTEFITNQFAYDSYGNIVSETDGLGFTTTYTYGITDGTFTYPNKIQNTLGHETKYEYDLGTGNIIKQTDQNNNQITYEYDALARIKKEILPYDTVYYPTKTYQYTLNPTPPSLIKITIREKNNTDSTLNQHYFYDGFGSLIQTKKESSIPNQQIIAAINHDSLKRVSSITNPYIASYTSGAEDSLILPSGTAPKTSYSYDVLNRVTKVTNPDNSQKTISYDHWKITSVDENGNKVSYFTDSREQITKILEHSINNYYTTVYQYNLAGDLVWIKDAHGNTFQYTYDMLGRKTQETDPDLGTRKYTYDNKGNLIWQTDNSGNTNSYTYDQLGRIKQKTNSDGTFTYTYDTELKGTLSSVTNSKDYTTSYTYDLRNRKTSETLSIDGKSFTSKWKYDSMNRPVEYIAPDNSVSVYDYSAQGPITKISGIIDSVTYNELNLPSVITLANKKAISYNYNPTTLRLNKILSENLDLSYGYDNAGNIINIRDEKGKQTENMLYDSLNRIASYKKRLDDGRTILNENYTIDAIGNIVSVKSLNGEQVNFFSKTPVHSPSKIITQTEVKEKKRGTIIIDITGIILFTIKNSLGGTISQIDSVGNLFIKGNIYQFQNNIQDSILGINKEIIIKSAGKENLAITKDGDIYSRGEFKNNEQIPSNISEQDFVIKNQEGRNIFYVNSSGAFIITGSIKKLD